MAPRNTADDSNPRPEESRDNEPKPPEEPNAPSEPTKKRIWTVDTAKENQRTSISIIGGVRAPKK